MTSIQLRRRHPSSRCSSRLAESIDVAQQDVQAAINAAYTYLPQGPAQPAHLQQGQPRRRAHHDAGADLATRCRSRRSKTSPTPSSRRRSRSSPASVSSPSTAARSPPCASRPTPPQLASYGLSLEDVRTALGTANVDQAKGYAQRPASGLHHRRQRPAHVQRRLQEHHRRLSQRQSRPPQGRRRRRSTAPKTSPRPRGWATPRSPRTRKSSLTARRSTSPRRRPYVKPAIILNIQRQPGANIIGVVDRVQSLLPQLHQSCPPASICASSPTAPTPSAPRSRTSSSSCCSPSRSWSW